MLGIKSWCSVIALDVPISAAPASDEDSLKRPSFPLHLCVVSPHFLWLFWHKFEIFSSGSLKLYALPHSVFLHWIYKGVYFMKWIGELNVVMKIPLAFDVKSIRTDGLRLWGLGNALMLEASGLRVYCGSHVLCLLVPYHYFLGGFSSCHSCPTLILKGPGMSSMKKFKGKRKEYEFQVKTGNVSLPIHGFFF